MRLLPEECRGAARRRGLRRPGDAYLFLRLAETLGLIRPGREVCVAPLFKKSLKETATTTAASAPKPMVCFHLISLVLCFAFEAVEPSNVIAADADEAAVSRMRRRSVL